MLIHGRDELKALAESCSISNDVSVQGWRTDVWEMTDSEVDAAVSTYEAILTGGVSSTILDLLIEQGFDLRDLLVDSDHSNDQVTRADVCELTAAASLVANPTMSTDNMFMPNVPKMSRRKSESGFDIVELVLDGEAGELLEHERLTIVSVKHTTNASTSYDLMRNLVSSISHEELTDPYVTSQLKVISSRLRESGVPTNVAERIYLFLQDFAANESVRFFAIGVIDPDLADDVKQRVRSLPSCNTDNQHFRIILLPGLRTLHERCS